MLKRLKIDKNEILDSKRIFRKLDDSSNFSGPTPTFSDNCKRSDGRIEKSFKTVERISKYYGCYYHKTGGRPWTEDIQLTADGNLIHPDEYYFYGESFDFEIYFEKLKTKQIGQHIYHLNTISSTMV